MEWSSKKKYTGLGRWVPLSLQGFRDQAISLVRIRTRNSNTFPLLISFRKRKVGSRDFGSRLDGKEVEPTTKQAVALLIRV